MFQSKTYDFPPAADFAEARAALLRAVDPAALGLTRRAPRIKKPKPKGTKHNPFAGVLEIATKRQREALLRSKAEQVSGEDRALLEVNEVRQVDKAAFVKIFRAALRAAFDLPAAGSRVFFLALALLETGADAVDLTWRAEWTPAGVDAPLALSRVTLWRGITALVAAGFLAPSTTPGRYWVNPARMFAGDRVRLVREYRVAGVSGARVLRPGEASRRAA